MSPKLSRSILKALFLIVLFGVLAERVPMVVAEEAKPLPNDFKFFLFAKRGENGTNAYWRNTRIQITGNKGHILESEGGRPPFPSPPINQSFVLTDSNLQAITQIISDDKLMESVVEEKGAAFTGAYVEMTLQITLNGRSSQIRLAGMKSRAMGGMSDFEHKELAEKIEYLGGFIKSLATKQ